jgi:hypothetical protein
LSNQTLRWYADDSELNAGFGAEIPDMFIFGGVVVASASERQIREEITRAKKHFAEPGDYPVKWNMKDLKKEFDRRGDETIYKLLMPRSKDLRRLLFLEMSALPIQILLSCILGHSRLRSILKAHKEDLSGHAFTNALMRFALEVRDRSGVSAAEVIVDWPARDNPKPFDNEYRSAFARGTTLAGVAYISGPLNHLGFSDTLVYANDTVSALLQLADLVVGAFKDFLRTALLNDQDSFGVEMLQLVSAKIRGVPNNILGRGISVSPAGPVKDKIETEVRSRLRVQG